MGTVWVLVTSTYNAIQLCDPDALMEIFRRNNDFPRPLHFYSKSYPAHQPNRLDTGTDLSSHSNVEPIWPEFSYRMKTFVLPDWMELTIFT